MLAISGNNPSGILIINKPLGWTSHDVVARLRPVFGVRKVGHAGTLDPLATGVLVVMVGRQATRLSDDLRGQDKEYVITLEFGKSTDTGDSEGKTVKKLDPTDSVLQKLSRNRLKEVLVKLQGETYQTVPWYSAVKVSGKKLYEIARRREGRGWKVEGAIRRPKRRVRIYGIKLINFTPATAQTYPQAQICAKVSSGTYTRVLVKDIGQSLKMPAYQTGLVRTRVGKYTLEQALNLKQVARSSHPAAYLLPIASLR